MLIVVVIFNLPYAATFTKDSIRPSRAAAPTPAPARVHVLAVPTRMVLVGIKPPAEHEMLAVLVAVLLGAHRRFDHLGQLAIGLIATLIGRLHMRGVGLDAGQRHAALAF